MSDPRSLPAHPDLRRLRDEAKARRRAGEFPKLALAHLAIAREHGFASWPALKIHVEALTLDAAQRARMLVRSACSFDVRRARALLAADPALARHDLPCACVTGEADEVARLIGRSPQLVRQALPPLGRQPILYACFSRLLRSEPDRAAGIREAVRLLLEAGADPNASFDHDGWLQVPLYGAAGIANDVRLTRMLIEAGADPNDAGQRRVGEALYHAVEFPDPACAEMLVKAGTDHDVVNHCLGRALNFADPAMVLMLCANGARASADHLHQAVMKRRPIETVQALLDAGAPVDRPDEHGVTALQMAIRWKEAEIVALLIERGANQAAIGKRDRRLSRLLGDGDGDGDGETAAADTDLPGLAELDELLDAAILAGDRDAVVRLLDVGARLDGDPDGDFTPLAQAAWRGQVSVVRELVKRGARLTWGDGSAIGAALHGSRHCQDPEGGPTMQIVQEIRPEPYAEVIQILLDAGAPIPEQFGERKSRPTTLLAELGVEIPLQWRGKDDT